MPQTGFTPILLYSSSTGGNAPAAADLTNNTTGSELAINITDGKLFYKDNTNAVQVIGWKTTPTTAGGTGLTSYTAGDVPYYASGTTLSKLGIGSSGQILTSTGTAPQWSTLSGVAVTTFSAGTTGLTPSSATSGAITLAGTLATTNGGTGTSTTFTAGSVVFAGASGVYSQNNSNFFWDNSNTRLGVGTASPAVKLHISEASAAGGSVAIRSENTTATGLGVVQVRGNAAKQSFFWQAGTTYTTYNSLQASNAGVYATTNLSYEVDGALYQSWWTNGSERMRLDSSGRLGVNTGTPRQILSVGATLDLYSGNANSPTVPSIRGNAAGTNMTVNAYGTGTLYLNFDSGTGGVIFSNGASGTAGSVDSSGNATMASFRPTSSTVPTNGMYLPAANTLGWATNSTVSLKLDSSGNLLNNLSSQLISASNSIQVYNAGPQYVIGNTVAGTGQSYQLFMSQYGTMFFVNNSFAGVYMTYGATSWTSTSDITKKNITGRIKNALDKIKNLTPATFTWKDDETNTPQVGLIAQEMQNVLPEVVSDDGEGVLGIRYAETVPLLLAAIQEQQAIIEQLKQKVNL